MCETMANIPVEDRAACVLTEDMFDAAMNEQFSYQDDIESEEELSSQEENMEVDVDTQGSSQDSSENVIVTDTSQCDTATSLNMPSCESPPVSVLVIETGLDKSKEDSNTTVPNNLQEAQTDTINEVDCSNTIDDISGEKSKESQLSLDGNELKEDETRKLPILKKILSNNPKGSGTIESIDLCDSDSEELSPDDEVPGESIDDELKSVMETNLMAEIGMSVNKQKQTEPPTANKTVENSPPKIAVKSMAQVPSNIFNTLPQKKIDNTTSSTELNLLSTPTPSNVFSEPGQFRSLSDMSLQRKEDIPTTIHINRIAVPHQTFVNSQGQKMKCVYVQNANAMPLVINSNSTSTTCKNLTNTLQLKKLHTKKMPPIVALSNMTIKNMQNQSKIVAKIPSKTIAIAPKFEKPPLLKNAPQRPHQFNIDQNSDSLIKSLLFHNLKKPYKPPSDISPTMVTYLCVDCSDRFVVKSSFSQHLARRSLSICYWCRICKVQLQFFNRCVFLKHLRGHNCSIKNIDTSCITFSPLPAEMIESGIASSFLKECSSDLPPEECILQKTVKPVVQCNGLTNNKPGNNIGLTDKPISSVIVHNPSNKKKADAGQTKSVSFQTKPSILLNKPNTSQSTSQASQQMFPILWSKPPQKSIVPLVQNINKKTKDQPALANKQVTNNVLVVRSSPPVDNVKKTSNMSSSTTNVVTETECNDIDDDDIVIDEDTEKTNENQEEEEVDVENVTENHVPLSPNVTSKQKPKAPTGKNTSLRRQCTECGTSCLNITKHLNGSGRPTNPKLICEVCQLILPTKCALKIHLRIHMKMPPFKCPDCGKDFNSWDDLNAHVRFSCGHLAKIIRYMCVACKGHFASAVSLYNHISTIHSRDIYKCTSCPVAFFNKDSLKKHLTTIHPNEPVMGTDYKQCSLCPKKLVPIDKFISHMQDHTRANNVLIYGYKCPLCSAIFANKMAFIIHQIKEKRETEEKANAANMIKNNNCMNSIIDKAVSNSTQEIDPLSDSDVEEEPVIVRKYPEPEDSHPTEKDPLSLDGWEHSQEYQVLEQREELCIVCKTNAVVLLPGIDPNDQSLCCKNCVKYLDVDPKSQTNKTHPNRSKAITYNSMKNGLDKTIKRKKNSPKAVQRSYSCDDVNTFSKKRKLSNHEFLENDLVVNNSLDSMPIKKKIRKKQYKDKATLGKEQSHIQGQVVTSKSSNELLCAKCKFEADTKEAFLEHITIHRTDPNTFQCLECGLCFVVLPSLERHLQINHGIKDVNLYIRENVASMPEAIVPSPEEDEEEYQETDDNECRVCHKLFDSSSSLEKHFRSHGMAFMNRLTKSP